MIAGKKWEYYKQVVFKVGGTAPPGEGIWTFRGELASKHSDGGVEIVKGALEQLQ